MSTGRIPGALRALLSVALVGAVGAAAADWASPETVEGATTVSLQQAQALHAQGVPFVDVRSARQFGIRHIPCAHHLDLHDGFSKDALQRIAAADQPLVIYCNGVKCSRSYNACEQAVEWGYTQVQYFRGGIAEWRRAGLPVDAP